MAYAEDKNINGLDNATITDSDYIVFGDAGDSDGTGVRAKQDTWANVKGTIDADDIDDTSTTNKFTTAGDISKLAGIEASADVTDATNVDAAGATMNTDTDVSGNSYVLDEDNLVSDSNTKLATQQSIKAYVDANSGGATNVLTTKGDILTRDASSYARLPIGSNGQVLAANSTEDTGLEWVSAMGVGDVTAATSFGTDNLLIRSDGTGKGVQASGISIDDSDNVSGVGMLNTLNLPASDFSGVSDTETLINKTIDADNNTITNIGTSELSDEGVTFAKMAHIATNRILGRDTAGTGDVEALADGAVRDIIGLATTDSPQFTAIELGHATDTTVSRSSAGVIAVEGVVIPSISSTNTFTNKRVTKRVGSTTSSATPTINTDNVDVYRLTAQAADITSFTTNLSGTPDVWDMFAIEIIGTATRSITWGASFSDGGLVSLPTTTVGTTPLKVLLQWNGSTWSCLSVA